MGTQQEHRPSLLIPSFAIFFVFGNNIYRGNIILKPLFEG